MNDIRERLARLGTMIPETLLPVPSIDMEAWAVIACDQYTQDRAYWKRVEDRVGSSPSALRMVLPEIFLEDGDRALRLDGIRSAMRSYRDRGVFAPPVHGAMYVERATPFHSRRRGLVLAVDLEKYEWEPSAKPLIRATEGTVVERIPPRMEIRRGAPLESPHVLLLIDDDERSLIEGLGERAKTRTAAYDTKLMLGAGSIQGWALDREEDWEYLARGLERLAARSIDRYCTTSGAPFLYAVGDGNHSLATAKSVWEEYKAANVGAAADPACPIRWALAEVENIYDEGIDFEPIHRVVFGASPVEVARALSALPGFVSKRIPDVATLERLVEEPFPSRTRYGLISPSGIELIETTATGLSTEPLQPILDAFVSAERGRTIDYLHGCEETVRVALDPHNASAVGILLPPVGKSDLFSTVARSGPLPRKSFSMGEAVEKRFYLECRRLFG